MQETILALLNSHSFLAFIGAFGAGSITAIAPCSLVSVPLLVASSLAINKDLRGRRKLFYTYAFTSLFALGVMFSFSILGFIVAKFGGFFSIAPTWAYISAGVLSILIALYAWDILGYIDKSGIMSKLIKYRLFGGFLIGVIFGLISTPCASAPLIAIVTVAANSGYVYAYGLILTFALGHSLLLLTAGISVGFTQSITSNTALARFSNLLNKSFAMLLLGFGIYFLYTAFEQF
jgi:cytochrome c biogenesis protein CcdA